MKQIIVFILALITVKSGMLSDAKAQFTACNQTYQPVDVAIGEYINGWVSHGWYTIEAGECFKLIDEALTQTHYYLYAKRDDGLQWMADNDAQKTGWLCVLTTPGGFFLDQNNWCGSAAGPNDSELQHYREVDTKNQKTLTYNLYADGEKLTSVDKGVVRQTCIVSWDDIPQIHSVQTKLTWNHQSIKTKMKKQRHCYQLTVTGPIDVEGLSKDFVRNCINDALNDKKNEYLLRALGALYLDLSGASGSASAANLYQYAENVSNKAISCLTDTGKINEHMRNVLSAKFDATVKKTSSWIYWYL